FRRMKPRLNIQNTWVFSEASEQETDKAVQLAVLAFEEYRLYPAKEKARFLRTIGDNLANWGDELLDVYSLESGLPKGRAQGERARTIFQLNSFADLIEEGSWVEATIDLAQPDRKPISKPDLRKMMVPLGPIAVFGSSNFPFAYSTAGGDTASALASGCTVVVKSHPMHAGTGEMVTEAIIKAAKDTHMPEGVFSNLNSSGNEVGQYLVKHHGIKGVGFTGSIQGGRALYNLAASRNEPIPVFAEMGSINPVVLLPEAVKKDALNWATQYAQSITLGTGQFCTNPGLLLAVEDEGLDQFIDMLSNAILKIQPDVMLHSQIVANYEGRKGEILSSGMVELRAEYQGKLSDNYAAPVIVKTSGKDFLQHPFLHKEVFGPFSMIVTCSDFNELEKVLINMEGQLTGTILSHNDELNQYPKIIAAMQNRVGRLIFNGVPTGVEVCPAMMHGGPYPASTDSRFTAVGIHAIKRWVRPVSYQNWPDELLPDALKNSNPLGIWRLIDQKLSKDHIQ
ncbi:MAG TPA: aldehyde dehydrogenase (NADP(+)), partial [Saprospiraceae bacterium]|nr:aldehyde dehydrogenase (NADP(+)) [Saprospiraceae bacterium]